MQQKQYMERFIMQDLIAWKNRKDRKPLILLGARQVGKTYILKEFGQREFENVIAWWDRLDANRERRERYHELSRSGDDVPLDYGASANELFFPDMLNDVLEKQLRKGDFIDAIFYCPYDIHELVTEEYLSKILWELNEEHKELLFLCAVRLFSSTRIAKIRNQSDRNIRKVRGTMLKKIRKKLLPALLDKAEKQQPMTLLEKDFLEENMAEIDSEEKK